jgi:hypothetical protein
MLRGGWKRRSLVRQLAVGKARKSRAGRPHSETEEARTLGRETLETSKKGEHFGEGLLANVMSGVGG